MGSTGAPERKLRGPGFWTGPRRAASSRIRKALEGPARRRGAISRLLQAAGLLVLLALTAASSSAVAAPRSRPSFAQDVVRRVGVGMVSPEAPLGARYLTSPRTGFEVGLGLTPAAGDGVDGTDVHLDGGLLLAMAPGHRVNFYLRPGIRFSSEHRSPGTYSTVGLSLGFSFEWFVTRDFSLTATQSLRLDLIGPPENDPAGPDDRTRLGLYGDSLPRFGFFYYLPEF